MDRSFVKPSQFDRPYDEFSNDSNFLRVKVSELDSSVKVVYSSYGM